MQPVTENFKSVVNAAVRNLEVVVKLIGKNETDYTNARIYSSKDMLLSLKIVDGQTTGGFGLGGTICPSLTAELHKTAVVTVGDKVKVELIVYNGGGNLTMASEFTVDNMRRKGDGTLLVVALGSMVKLSKNYVSQLTYPTTQLAVLEEIAEQTGFELHPLITSEMINDPVIQTAPVKGKAEDGSTLYYTRREMLGYAAAINGGAAFIDQYGRIALARHNDTGEAFTHERVLQETISDPFEIAAVKWNSSGLSYALGDDYNENTVEFYNPLIYNARELIAHNLETDLIGFDYDGAIIKKQGCGYFEVGDIVRYTDISGTVHKLIILGIVYEFVGGYFSETLYSLTSTATQREYAGNEVVSNQIGGGQAVQEATTPQPLTTYSIISDTSVQCNGRRYDIETDSTGLISRITDDLGGVLVPENVAAPADLALHNAVLWAVAMARGLASPQPSGEYVYICTDYDAEKKLWTNQSGAPPLDLSAALINSDGIHGNVWWTVPVIPNPLGQFTFYAVARAADFDSLPTAWTNVITNEGAIPQFNLTVHNKKWSIGTQEDTGFYDGDTYSTDWRVLAVRRNGTVGEFYVDDSLRYEFAGCYPQIGDVDENFQINGVDFKFRYIGIFNEYHDDATLKAKIAELQQTYYTELPAVNDWKPLQSSTSGSYKTSETLSGAIPHSETGYAMLVISTRYMNITLTDDTWELFTQSTVTNNDVTGQPMQTILVYLKPLSEFDGSDYSVTVGATRFIWASLSYFTDAAKISVAHTANLAAQNWVTPAKTEPTKRLYFVTVTDEVTPSVQSAVDGTDISYIKRVSSTRMLMAYDYKTDMMSPLNIDTATSSTRNCRATLVLDIE